MPEIVAVHVPKTEAPLVKVTIQAQDHAGKKAEPTLQGPPKPNVQALRTVADTILVTKPDGLLRNKQPTIEQACHDLRVAANEIQQGKLEHGCWHGRHIADIFSKRGAIVSRDGALPGLSADAGSHAESRARGKFHANADYYRAVAFAINHAVNSQPSALNVAPALDQIGKKALDLSDVHLRSLPLDELTTNYAKQLKLHEEIYGDTIELPPDTDNMMYS